MTRPSHFIAPKDGHKGSGRGSTNSEGSRWSSVYSFTRSNATYSVRLVPEYADEGRNTIDCSNPTNLRTINRRSLVTVEAKARANPAIDAVIPGVTRQANAVAPTMTAESRLKRIDNQRFTVRTDMNQSFETITVGVPLTSPHPIIWIRILLVSDKLYLKFREKLCTPYQRIEAYLAKTWRTLQKLEGLSHRILFRRILNTKETE